MVLSHIGRYGAPVSGWLWLIHSTVDRVGGAYVIADIGMDDLFIAT